VFSENQIGYKLKGIQTDNAKEFLALQPFLNESDFNHRLTCPYTHEQNSVIKCKHRHINDMRLILLANTSLLVKF